MLTGMVFPRGETIPLVGSRTMMGAARMRELCMCDKCTELDQDIEILQRVHAMADDKLALVLVEEAIAALQTEKASLHPEEQK